LDKKEILSCRAEDSKRKRGIDLYSGPFDSAERERGTKRLVLQFHKKPNDPPILSIFIEEGGLSPATARGRKEKVKAGS